MSGFEISQATLHGTHHIQRYGDRGFLIADERYDGSVFVCPDQAERLDAPSADDVTLDQILAFLQSSGGVEILVFGCGEQFIPPRKELRSGLGEHGVVLEWMDTGAACRTFNVLLSEARRVAAVLIAVE